MDHGTKESRKLTCFSQFFSNLKSKFLKHRSFRKRRRRERKEREAEKRSTKMMLQKTAIPKSIKVVNMAKARNSLRDSFSLGSWNAIIHAQDEGKHEPITLTRNAEGKIAKRLSSITVATLDCVVLKDEVEDEATKLLEDEKIENTHALDNSTQKQPIVLPTTTNTSTTLSLSANAASQWAIIKKAQSVPSLESTVRVLAACNNVSRLPLLALTEYYRHLSMPRNIFSSTVPSNSDDAWSIPAAVASTDASIQKTASHSTEITLASF